MRTANMLPVAINSNAFSFAFIRYNSRLFEAIQRVDNISIYIRFSAITTSPMLETLTSHNA